MFYRVSILVLHIHSIQGQCNNNTGGPDPVYVPEVDHIGIFRDMAVSIYMATCTTMYSAIYHIYGHVPYIWLNTIYMVYNNVYTA